MNNNLHFSTGENDVETPDAFFRTVDNLAGGFVWDLAAVQGNRKCDNYYGPDHRNVEFRNCLTLDWPLNGPLWLNPPYGKPEEPCKSKCHKLSCPKRGFHITTRVPGCEDFIAKAYEQCQRGANIWLLLAARTDNNWFHRYIWSNEAQDFQPHIGYREFVEGRLKFTGQKDSAPFPSLLVQFCG